MVRLTNPQKALAILFFSAIFLYSLNQINNSDTFYHLKSGEYILSHLSIPSHDIFSLTAYGADWVPHEWLAQIIFYPIYAVLGAWGLVVFCALIGVLTYFILWRLALKKGIDFNLSLLILLLLSYLTLELFVPRPQIFSYLSLAALIYFLESWRDNPDKKYLAGCTLAIWFWANTNASFVLGIVVIGFYLVSEFVSASWKLRPGKIVSPGELKNLAIAAAISAALGIFATPAGYRGLLYNYYIGEVANYLGVMEWKPITVFLYETQAQIFVAMIFLVDAFFAWWFLFKRETRDITLAGLVFGISLMPFISIRHVGFWPIAVFVPAAVSLTAILEKFSDKFSSKAFEALLAAVALLFIASRLFWMQKSPINENIIPVSAVDFIKENNIRGPLFNLYNEGNYLIYRLWPDDKVFIDGRSEVYRGKPIIEFFTVFGLHPGWENLIDEKYKVNYFFLDSYYSPTVRKYVEPLVDKLLEKKFKLVYWDDLTIILVRDTPENKAVIDKYGMKYVNPFISPSDIPLDANKEAAKEIQSLMDRYPQSLIIQDYANRFLGSYSKSRFTPSVDLPN